MVNTECYTDNRKATHVPRITEKDAWTETTRTRRRQAVASPSRRFDRVSIGFWLGGASFGTGGCILGYCMPYQHSVAIAISMIWWSIYIGCFGASLGALIGLFTRFAPGRRDCVLTKSAEKTDADLARVLGPSRWLYDRR
jgi:hypothetical protein